MRRARTTSRWGSVVVRAMSSRTIRCSLSSTTRSGGAFAAAVCVAFIFQLDHAAITDVKPRLITDLRGAVLSA
jgi:hypothetical protein